MRKNKITKKCSNCGNTIEVYPQRLKEHNYCSRKCCIVFQYKIGQRIGKKITKKAHKTLRERGHYKSGNEKYKSKIISLETCKKISEAKLKNNWMRGRKSPSNMGGKTTYRGHRWKAIKLEVRDRDKVCKRCGITNEESIEKYRQNLQVDHIIPYRVSFNGNLDNLQTLCCSCHGKKWSEDFKLIRNLEVTRG